MDIQFKQVSYTYQENTPFAHHALNNINLEIQHGEFIAIVGHTGSGKSTLLQHMNGLLLPTRGQVKLGDYTLSRENKRQDLRKLREKVGIVFQYPEHQLFEETVKKDICFGPKNFQVPESVIEERITDVMKMVRLPEDLLEKSPFELSGGQMRRVAIAGVLAMYPEVLILDEPTAGLDPLGQQDIMKMFYKLHRERQLTTVMVTHQMDQALRYADRIIVLVDGKIYMQGKPQEVFSKRQLITGVNLELPEILQVIEALNERFRLNLTYHRQTAAELAGEIASQLQEWKIE